jgi:hypothetical protein
MIEFKYFLRLVTVLTFFVSLLVISNIVVIDVNSFSSDEVERVVLGSSGRSYDKIQIKSVHGMDLQVVKGDLFKADKNVSLAHCISADFKLGKGIAKMFREKFGRIQELEQSGAKVGEVAVLKDNERFVSTH